MSNGPDNVVLTLLRRVDKKLDRVVDDVHDIKLRMTGVEENLAGMQGRTGRFENRVGRVEECLELSDSRFAELAEKFEDS